MSVLPKDQFPYLTHFEVARNEMETGEIDGKVKSRKTYHAAGLGPLWWPFAFVRRNTSHLHAVNVAQTRQSTEAGLLLSSHMARWNKVGAVKGSEGGLPSP